MTDQKPLEIESLTPDDLGADDLEDVSGGTVCADYVSCKGFGPDPTGPKEETT